MPRIRRPLLALLVLVIALVIGYGIRAARSDGAPRPPASAHPSDAVAQTPAQAAGPRALVIFATGRPS